MFQSCRPRLGGGQDGPDLVEEGRQGTHDSLLLMVDRMTHSCTIGHNLCIDNCHLHRVNNNDIDKLTYVSEYHNNYGKPSIIYPHILFIVLSLPKYIIVFSIFRYMYIYELINLQCESLVATVVFSKVDSALGSTWKHISFPGALKQVWLIIQSLLLKY